MEAGVYDLMVRAHIRAEEYVNYYKPVILQVASELLAHGSLYGSHVRDLVDDLEFEGRLGDLTDAHVDRIIEQVEEALDALAARGYAHNDLRASNVLVFSFCARDPAATRVKLCDFGDCAPGPRDATLPLRHEIAELRCA